MNAQTKQREFAANDDNRSVRSEAMPLPLLATQSLFTAADACRADPPRRAPWPGPAGPWYRRFAGAIGRALEPRQPRYPLTEHICRDIGLEWTPEPRVRTWPW